MENKTIVVFELGGGRFDTCLDMQRRVYSPNGIAPTLRARLDDSPELSVKILVEDKNGS